MGGFEVSPEANLTRASSLNASTITLSVADRSATLRRIPTSSATAEGFGPSPIESIVCRPPIKFHGVACIAKQVPKLLRHQLRSLP